MSLFTPGWDFAQTAGLGALGTCLLAVSGQMTEPLAQNITAVAGLLLAVAALLRAAMAYHKLQFRMAHYKEPEALKAIPDSDDDIPAATERKPKTMRSPRKPKAE